MSYPIYWCDTVTVLHRYNGSDGSISWSARTYNGCFFQAKESSLASSGNRSETCRYVCRFRSAPAALAIGDIICKGTVSATINEYGTGTRSTDFLSAHQGDAFVVNEVHDNTGSHRGIPHVYAGGAAHAG